MTKYVAGFLFDETCEGVALIEKQKPEWQKGLFNGIGGKVEDGETYEEAMEREFEEETGVTIFKDEWKFLCEISGKDYTVKFYYGITDKLANCATMEGEKVLIISPEDLHNWKVIDNLRWLIPLAIDRITQYSPTISLITSTILEGQTHDTFLKDIAEQKYPQLEGADIVYNNTQKESQAMFVERMEYAISHPELFKTKEEAEDIRKEAGIIALSTLPSATENKESNDFYQLQDISIENVPLWLCHSPVLKISVTGDTKEQAIKEFAISVSTIMFYKENIHPKKEGIDKEEERTTVGEILLSTYPAEEKDNTVTEGKED